MSVIPDIVRSDLARLHIAVSDAELERIARYLALLLEANEHFNLTAVRDPEQAWRRHIVDSLTLLPLLAGLPAGSAIIDVGSGGGLPGVPLAIALPNVKVTLLEATGKKARFLERCVKELPLTNARVISSRAETMGREAAHRQKYDAAVCRAIGPMRELLEYLLPLVKVGGRALAMKGPRVAAELDQAADALALLGADELDIVEAYPEDFGMDAVVVRVTKTAPTPKPYPRAPGMAHHQPL